LFLLEALYFFVGRNSAEDVDDDFDEEMKEESFDEHVEADDNSDSNLDTSFPSNCDEAMILAHFLQKECEHG
jgi:hypothetical protein